MHTELRYSRCRYCGCRYAEGVQSDGGRPSWVLESKVWDDRPPLGHRLIRKHTETVCKHSDRNQWALHEKLPQLLWKAADPESAHLLLAKDQVSRTRKLGGPEVCLFVAPCCHVLVHLFKVLHRQTLALILDCAQTDTSIRPHAC